MSGRAARRRDGQTDRRTEYWCSGRVGSSCWFRSHKKAFCGFQSWSSSARAFIFSCAVGDGRSETAVQNTLTERVESSMLGRRVLHRSTALAVTCMLLPWMPCVGIMCIPMLQCLFIKENTSRVWSVHQAVTDMKPSRWLLSVTCISLPARWAVYGGGIYTV